MSPVWYQTLAVWNVEPLTGIEPISTRYNGVAKANFSYKGRNGCVHRRGLEPLRYSL